VTDLEFRRLVPDVVRLMRDLADGLFDVVSMSGRAAAVGERKPISPLDDLISFTMPGSVWLNLLPGAREEDATETILTLDGWDPGVASNIRDDPDHVRYDRYYWQAREVAVSLLGDPTQSGNDQGPFPHNWSYPFQWSVWLGTSGLMALQQSHYDYCPDINIWVRRQSRNGFVPTEPFYEWLMAAP
jgi:hypothetical protein